MQTGKVPLDMYSAPNLFKNGGFELNDFDFWEYTGYSPSIKTAAVDSVYGCRVYATVLLSSGTPFVYRQYFQQQNNSFMDIMERPEKYPVTRIEMPLNLSTSSPSFYANDTVAALADDSIFGTSVTLGISLRVRGGTANIYGVFYYKSQFSDEYNSAGDLTQTYASELVTLSAGDFDTIWHRPTCTFGVEAYIYAVGLHVERVSGSPQVDFGNIQLVEGAHDTAPYTGCLFCKSVPKTAIVMSIGPGCPSGYEKVEGVGNFIRAAAPGEVGGSDSHTHTYNQSMRGGTDESQELDDDWPRVLLINDKKIASLNSPAAAPAYEFDSTDRVSGDDGRVAHEHTISSPGKQANSIPNWKGVLLCRRK